MSVDWQESPPAIHAPHLLPKQFAVQRMLPNQQRANDRADQVRRRLSAASTPGKRVAFEALVGFYLEKDDVMRGAPAFHAGRHHFAVRIGDHADANVCNLHAHSLFHLFSSPLALALTLTLVHFSASTGYPRLT